MILKADNLSKAYNKNDREFYAVKEVSLAVKKGEFIIIVGRSGSGKSTLLNMLAGLIKPTSGHIFFGEEDISEYDDEAVSFFRNDKIGYVMQGNGALSNMTVLENVLFPAYIFDGNADPSERARELLERVGMYEYRDEYPKSLSGGELKRVETARALINRPDILLADEPTGNLDEKNSHEIMKLFKEISEEGTSVIVVTHDKECLSYADKVYMMSEGHLKET